MEKNNCLISEMKIEDLENIKDILETDFDEFWNYETLKEELESNFSKYFIAKQNDNIVGFAGLKIILDEADLMNIVTKKCCRHEGIASNIMDKLIEYCKQEKIKCINLEVNIQNSIAINFYKKYNFKEVGLRKKYYDIKIKNYNKKIEKEAIEENKKILDEKLKKVIIAKEKFEEKNAKILKNREAKRKEPYKIRYNKNKNAKWLILIMAICVLTGLLTPLGDTPYTYLYKTMKGNTTKSISEHLPLTLINNKEMLVVLTATLALLIFTDTKIRLKDLFMFAGLTLLMFMTRRQESMLVLLGSAVLATLITQLFMKYDSNGLKEFEDIAVSSLGTIAVVLLIVLLSVIEIKPKLDDKFVNPSTYPVDAAKYIKENLDVNSIKLFNEYNYGSYLLFEEIPVFIDSRADLYAPEFNGVKGKDGKYEGQDIFSDYINTSNISKYYENTFNTYGITHVIFYYNSKLNIFLSRCDRYKELYSYKKFVIYERD